MTIGAEPVFLAIDRSTKSLNTETVEVIEAFGRIASRSITSSRDMPKSDVSALDGFAVKGRGNTFVRTGVQEMGAAPIRLKEGQAVFVPTGAPFPRNGRFVMDEHVREEDGAIITTQTEQDERKAWEKGSWLKKGTRVIEKGRPITAAVMENLSLAGISTVDIYRRVDVAVMTTGDEIVSGVVPDSNRYLLTGLIQEDGGSVRHIRTAPDRTEEMADAIRQTGPFDLLVITGGTARGKRDVTRDALREAGARFFVDRPGITPGKTMAFGLVGSMSFFLLPGNPKSIRSLYERFVRRCLMRLQGHVTGSERIRLYGE
jgi:molybdopterin molybdotransferase